MAAPNPYFIYIELYWSDGTRPNQNQIARVKAFDVYGGVTTEEGQSGYNPNNGGWYPVYMQNIAAFYPPRERPSLRFEVWNTAEHLEYSTQVFNDIPCGATVRIRIGVGAEVVGGSSSSWVVYGVVRHLDNSLVTTGRIRAFDITNGSVKDLASTWLTAQGSYSIGYTTADFSSNGGTHSQPNLRVRAYNALDEFLGESALYPAAAINQEINFTIPNEPTVTPTKRRVFGAVRNPIALPVSGIVVEAYHVAWTVQGIKEFQVGPITPPTNSNGAGDYEILYDPPVFGTPTSPCCSAGDQINLIVYAKAPGTGGTLETLFRSDIVYDAPAEQRVDLVVNRTAVSTSSEYQRIHDAISPCLGATESGKWDTLNQLNSRPEYLSFVAKSSGQSENVILAYVRAWLIAGEINTKVPASALSRPMAPQVIYGLLRIIDAESLAALLNVQPDQFFDTIVRAVLGGIVASSLEADLYPSPTYGNKSLLDDWRVVLAKLMSQSASWQGPLLNLVFPDVLSEVGTAFGTDTTAHDVPMPTAIAAGDLLIVLFANDGLATVSLPSGWTLLRAATSGSSTSAVRFGIYAKIAQGNESDTKVNFQTSAAEQAAANVYHIAKSSWAGSLAQAVGIVHAAPVTGSGTNINPPSTPTGWTSTPTLWFACAAHDREFKLTEAPTGYTDSPVLRTQSSTNANSCTVLSARRETKAATEDPASFIIATGDDWVADTIGIGPGTMSQAQKREAVASAHFDHPGSFAELLIALKAGGFSDDELENLTFVFEMYERVERYFPIVAAVYARKYRRKWHSVRDLATVTIDDGPDGEDWLRYAYASLSFSNGKFPSDVPGNNTDEQAAVYAARLFAVFGEVGTTERFTDELATPLSSHPEFAAVADFLDDHADFELERTNVDKYLKDNELTPYPSVVAAIKQVQRVYRLTTDFDAAVALIDAGLDSAVRIARLDEGQFIADYEEVLGGITAAQKIYRVAAHYASEVLFTLVKFHQNLNQVGGLSALPGGLNFTYLDPTEGLLGAGDITTQGDEDSRKYPNWITLFGDLNKCACKDCQTVLSPGAYLVDLLEFVDGAPKKTLFERRPDLSDIEITCTNTNTVLPYIDLVNEALEAVVQPLAFSLPALIPDAATVFDGATDGNATQRGVVYDVLAAQSFMLGEKFVVRRGAADRPGSTPVYREWVIEDEAWRFSIRQTAAGPAFTVYPSPQTSPTNDSLEVFPEHYNVGAYTQLEDAVFPFNLPLELGREETQLCLKPKNVARHDIIGAFRVDGQAAQLQDPSLGLAYLDLTAAEAAAIIGLNRPAREYWGFSTATATIPRPDKPTLEVTGSWVDLLALVPVFLHRSGLHYAELLELLDTEFVHRDAANPHGLHVAAPAEELVECNYNQFQIAHLNEASLGRIGCFIRLWRKLGWRMRDLDRYLMELEGESIPAPDTATPSNEASRLLRLSQVTRLVDDLKLQPRVAIAFYRPIDTRRTQRNPRSLFDDIFMNGSPTQPEIIALEQVARGQDITLSTGTDLKAHVRGALRLKSEEIELLWAVFVESTTPTTLNLEKLSCIYRIAALCAALKLSVTEYYDLVALTGKNPLPSKSLGDTESPRSAILESFYALGEFQIARKPKMSAEEMTYYLTDAHEEDDPFAVSTADFDTAVLRLAAAGQAIADANPEAPSADASSLTPLLGKVIPADKVNSALDIIAVPVATDSVQLAFVERYCGAFSGGASAFLAALAVAANPTVRYQIVWARLHRYLIETARTTAAVTVAAELVQTDEETASVLLSEALSRTSTTSARAIEDWKAMLIGGWDTGEAVLDNAGPGVRNGAFIASKSGNHRFVVAIDPTATAAQIAQTVVALTITVDGEVLTLAPGAAVLRAGHQEIEFAPVSLRANAAYAITFSYTSTASPAAPIDLQLRVENADPVLLAAAAVMPFNAAAYTKLFKAVRLSRGLALSKAEFRYLVEHPSVLSLDALPVTSGTSVAWAMLANLIQLLELNRSVALKKGTLFEFWREAVDSVATPPTPTLKDVATQTGWSEGDITAILGLWSGTAPGWDDPALWYVLRSTLGLARRLEIRVEQILSLLVAGEPTIASAATLRNVLRARYSRDAWKEIFKPLRDPLRQRQRDALVGYLTTRPIAAGPGGTNLHFFDANDLFAHFLIDVEMEPDTLISRIKLALNAVQLFVHRVFLGLEDAASLGELKPKKEQWTWMEKYRVWEANRKVFLYPENWIEPELRDDKTEFFKELEDELLQTPITHENAIAAVAGYLEKMGEVSNLEIVGSYTQGVYGSDQNFVLHVIGRTRSRPRAFYYRTFEGKQTYDGKWNPWTRVNLEIDADVVAPVFANGRFSLIWPKVVTKERPKPYDHEDEGKVDGDNVANEGRTEYQAEIRLMWSEYIPKKNKWSKPKLSKNRAMDENAPTPFQRELGEDEARTENYHLRVKTETNHVIVDVVRTDVPLGPTEIEIVTEKIRIFWWVFTWQHPKEVASTLSPSLLGTFRVWYTGDDTFEDKHTSTTLGSNYPIGTILKSNAAIEVDYGIDSMVSKDTLQFMGNVPYFGRTPDTFRIFSSNFAFSAEAGKEPFFFETCSKSLFALDKPPPAGASMTQQTVLRNAFSTFNHPLVQRFEEQLHAGGMEALMDRLTEALPTVDDGSCGCGCGCGCGCACNTSNCYLGYHIAGDGRAWGLTQRMFEGEFQPNTASVDNAAYPLPTVEFGYGTSYGIYNWELFFHAPMLIGARLSQDLKFEDAMRWYHYVFDPRQSLNTYELTKRWVEDLPDGSRYWTFLPFFANKDTTDSLLDTLGLTETLFPYERDQLTALIAEWRNNPFNPHLIARHRISAYQKFVVMKYLDNLIAWGDQLFRQDTFETINEATQLYILADDLLGGRPEDVEPLTVAPRLTYRELKARGIDEFSNAIVEVESMLVCNRPHLKDGDLPGPSPTSPALRSLALNSFYFTIPRNERLDHYWDIVKDRLFKIRNSMNIDGVKRRLALFEPPIDPALLVRAAAAGLDLGSVLAQLNSPLPCYRFNVWLQKANELTSELKSFGAALLAALERKDAESLQLLRQGHEIRMLELVRKVRRRQIAEAEANIKALELSRTLAEERRDYYQSRVKVSDGEQAQLGLTIATTVLEGAQGALHGIAGMFGAIPDSTVGVVGPFPTALANIKIGSAGSSICTQAANVLGVAASITRGLGTLAGLNAGYERRWDDWQLQLHLAQKEIIQIDQQIAVANIRLDIAEKELENQEAQLEQAQEMLEFFKDKFTNRDLYQWMVAQLSRTYQQIYRLTYDTAKTAERCFEFELGVTGANFIQFEYLDSLHQGLLAGEKLGYDLKRLDIAYLERNKRELEIQKPISLATFNGEALQNLRETGECQFELPEVLFDLDFPGHYFRRIKAVRVTIPCVTGPHTSVSAKLNLVGSAYRKVSAVDADSYPFGGVDDERFVHDPIGIVGIATGRAQGDSGLFELNFRDERYLPFEGAGAISRWKLELPKEVRQFDYNTISDLVLELSYTARDGGGLAQEAANGAIRVGLNRILALAESAEQDPTGLVRVFSLKKEFPEILDRLLTQPASTAVAMTILPEHFPFAVRRAGKNLKLLAGTGGSTNPVLAHVLPKAGVPLGPTNLSLDSVTLKGVDVDSELNLGKVTLSKQNDTLLSGWNSETWTLRQSGMTTATIDDIVLSVKYTMDETA